MAARQCRRPTMNDVARDADVSLKTVSRVVNRMTTVDPAMTVGIDDFETSRLLPISVRIVDYDAAGLGRIAAERVFARLDGDTTAPRTTLLPFELVSRGGFAP